MNHSEIPDIDELLNSFIDGELDQRHQTEVQRLIKHDKRIAERLQSLQKCKRLVSSLPYAEAPKEVLGNIKASLEEKKLISSAARPVLLSARREREGARHLLLRRLTAAAAMIGLVAVLAAVIYSILAPESLPQEAEPAAIVATAEKPVGQTTTAETKFTGRLELKTGSLPEVAAFLNKAIEFNIPSGQRSSAIPGRPRESFALNCGRQNLKLLLDELDTIWDKIDSATLFIQTDRPEGQIVIDAVAPQQIIEIARQDDFETQLKTAKYFAAMNNIAERLPGKEVLAAIGDSTPRLITIPKPVLTSSEKPITKPPVRAEDSRVVHLTITVVER
jgi:hypothetical protein